MVLKSLSIKVVQNFIFKDPIMYNRTYLIEDVVWPNEISYPPKSILVTVEGDEQFDEYEMYWTELVESKLKTQLRFIPESYVGKQV